MLRKRVFSFASGVKATYRKWWVRERNNVVLDVKLLHLAYPRGFNKFLGVQTQRNIDIKH